MNKEHQYIVAWVVKTGACSWNDVWAGYESHAEAQEHYDRLLSKQDAEECPVVCIRMSKVSASFEK